MGGFHDPLKYLKNFSKSGWLRLHILWNPTFWVFLSALWIFFENEWSGLHLLRIFTLLLPNFLEGFSSSLICLRNFFKNERSGLSLSSPLTLAYLSQSLCLNSRPSSLWVLEWLCLGFFFHTILSPLRQQVSIITLILDHGCYEWLKGVKPASFPIENDPLRQCNTLSWFWIPFFIGIVRMLVPLLFL